MAQLIIVPAWVWEGEQAMEAAVGCKWSLGWGSRSSGWFSKLNFWNSGPRVNAELESLIFTMTVTFSATQGWLCPLLVVPMPKGKSSEGGWHVEGAKQV